MNRTTAILLLVLMCIITWMQFQPVASAVISLAGFCAMLVTEPGAVPGYWTPLLLEYWIAAGVWVVGAGLLAAVIVHRTRPDRKNTVVGRALRALLLTAGVALTAPFLVPVDPNAQGSLATMRQLPPLSAGSVREFIPDETPAPADRAGGPAVRRAKAYLLGRHVTIGREPDPAWQSGGAKPVRAYPLVFLFGTDDNARDVFSRVISGTRVSVGIGLLAALGAVLLGCAAGFVSGMGSRWLDALIMRSTDLFLAVPGLFFAVAILAFAGQSVAAVTVVLAATGWMGIARLIRGEVIALREREFMEAARLLRVPRWRIILRHGLSNIAPVILTAAVLQFANAVLGEAALGFLGLGIQPPTASWGNMMGEATGYLTSAWWVGVFPGLFLALVLLCAHHVAEEGMG